jgi:hypothetical protein
MTTTIPDKFTECYVAFLDILGVKAHVKRSQEQPELYRNIVAALVEAKNLSVFRSEKRDVQTGDLASWSLQVQAFSDCVVLFIPTESQMLSWLLASIRRLHDRMIRLDVCLRGAITVGGMHWNPQWSHSPGEGEVTNRAGQTAEMTPVAFGPGLVAAYELENGCAVYPRVLVANELYDRVEKLGGKAGQAFPLANAGKLIDFIRQDFDGLWHIDLLNKDVSRRDVVRQVTEHDDQGRAVVRNEFDETTYEDRLKEFGRFVARNLDLLPKEPVLAKYQWCARYFNEKARAAGVNTIPIFKDEVPKGAIPLTLTTRSQERT